MELVLIVEINHIQSSMNLLDLNAPILGYDTVYGTMYSSRTDWMLKEVVINEVISSKAGIKQHPLQGA